MAESRQGCWVAVSKCFWGPPKSGKNTLYMHPDSDNIEFEDLVSADERAKAVPVQVVTDAEKEHIQAGKVNEFLEEQRKLDEAKDAELRRQEELLRQEEEAYYAAKRAAAQKAKLAMAAKQTEVQPLPVLTNRTSIPVIQEQPVSSETSSTASKLSVQSPPPVPSPEPSTARKLSLPQLPSETSTPSKPPVQQISPEVTAVTNGSPHKAEVAAPVTSNHHKMTTAEEDEEEEDFDQFLESVKITQQQQGSFTASANDRSSRTPTDPSFEVDFGYWETATELNEEPVVNTIQGTVK